MDKTFLVFAPQTARNLTILTEHVAVMLVGWDLTVVLVIVKLFKYFNIQNEHVTQNGSSVLYFEKYCFSYNM